MITPSERLLATVNGQPTDRIPIFCNLLDQGARELGVALRDYYRDGTLVAEAQLRMREKYGHDNVWCLSYVGKEAELLGCREILFAEDGPPNVADFVIQEPADIHKLHVPDDLTTHPAFRATLDCLKVLRAEIGGKVPICAYLTASTTLPAMLMGMDKWLELLLFGPTELRDLLLAKCCDFFHKQYHAYRAAGADLLCYSSPFTSTDFLPRRLIREFTLPWMERDLLPCGFEGVVYFCAQARVVPSLDLVLERLPPPTTVYLGPDEDSAAAKRIVTDRALTCGIINDIKLCRWSEQEVRVEVKRLIEMGKPGGRFFIGTSVMPLAIPERNIHAYIEAASEYGCWNEGNN
ncbi:Uroporphyrinogen decarboxylase [Gammaproteobacteria bacterium]